MAAEETPAGPRPGRRSDAFDVTVGLACAALSGLLAAPLLRLVPGWHAALLSALLAVATLSLAWRRRAPVRTFAVHVTAGVGALVAGLPMVMLGLAPLIALYSVALCRPRRQSRAALSVAGLALLTGEAAAGFPQLLSTVVVNVAALTAAWAAGCFVNARHADLRALDATNRELQAAREDLARAAVTEERLRMARELHDIVAHSLSMIAVQSGVGAHVAVGDPEASRRALATIEEVSRQALTEMRHVVKVLRESGDRDREADPRLAPVPGLAQLAGLADRVGDTGLQVDLVHDGDPAPVPAAVGNTAYRIVQESLTNVVSHAHATQVQVRVSCTDADVRVEVVDDGRTTPVPAGTGRAGGNGLPGMRERAQLLGGTLDAGPLRDGGFRVAARLPLHVPTRAPAAHSLDPGARPEPAR